MLECYSNTYFAHLSKAWALPGGLLLWRLFHISDGVFQYFGRLAGIVRVQRRLLRNLEHCQCLGLWHLLALSDAFQMRSLTINQ